MEKIGDTKVWSFFGESWRGAGCRDNTAVRKEAAHRVHSYMDLANKVAELQFRNRDHVLLFRGQNSDYVNQHKNTSLKPSLFRPEPNVQDNPGPGILIGRFERLNHAEKELVRHYDEAKLLGMDRVRRHRILRWAILQHYEVCATPLLDVTHSLRHRCLVCIAPGTR